MRKLIVLFPVVLFLCIPLIVRAGHVENHVAGKVTICSEGLSWDANTEPDMASYRVFLGRASGVYDPPVSVPHAPVPRILIPCADAGVSGEGQYYFAVSAVDQAGNESLISDEFPFFVDGPPMTPGGLDVN